MSRSGIVNEKMIITEEKIVANIDKIQKLINPKNKKQIIELDEDTYFKDLIESVKSYIVEFPNKKKFPISVYETAYKLVEFAIEQFEENTKKVEELIKQREENIALASELNSVIEYVDNKQENWNEKIYEIETMFSEDIIEALNTLGRCKGKTSQKYTDAMKVLKTRVNNLEANLHIEIDMDRLEDSSKALSYIGIEIADALKLIPTPEEAVQEKEEITQNNIQEVSENVIEKGKKKKKEKRKENVCAIVEENATEESNSEIEEYKESIKFTSKPSLWQKIKNSKVVRVATYIFRIKIRLELPSNALPEGRGENINN